MPKQNWKITAGLVVVIIAAIFWMGLGIFEFLFNTGSIFALVKGGSIGLILLLSALIAYSWRYIGGWALVIEGVLPVAIAIAVDSFNPFVLIFIAGPPIIGGILFLLD